MTEREILAAIRRVREALRELPRTLERREREVTDDDDLTDDEKKIRLRKIREDERAKQQKLHKEMGRLTKEAEKLAKQKALVGGTKEAHSRVRRLIASGLPVEQIVARAEEMEDFDTLRALRAEVNYVGTRHGWADARATVAACNQALARLGHESEQTLVEIDHVRKPLDVIAEFAGKSVMGQATPTDRIKLGHALSGEED